MLGRPAALAAALCLLLPAVLAANTLVPHAGIVVALLDTGIDGLHTEFGGYVGQPNTPNPQIVAWWDFGVDGPAPPGALWDSAHPVPYDVAGHGTGTASLVGGATLGTCPGVKLAVAKIADASGNLVNIDAALQWAAKTVGADVISMSFGTVLPDPAMLDNLDEHLAEARALGVLPVASAGNGLENVGAKYPSELQSPAYSPDVLSVGAGSQTGATTDILLGGIYTNTDPEVSAWGTGVTIAHTGGGFTTGSGTSFSAPKVAGYAACLMAAALANGQIASPDRIETLLKDTAHDNVLLPYTVEGYGWVDAASYAQALALAQSGAAPPAPSALNAAADAAAQAFKVAWTQDGEPRAALLPGATSTPGTLGPSLPGGVSQAELYSVTLAARDAVHVHVAYANTAPPALGLAANDLDAYLFMPGAAADGVLDLNEARAVSAQTAGLPEDFTYVAPAAGTYLLLVHGFAVVAQQPFMLTADVNSFPVAPAFVNDVLLAGSLAPSSGD